MKLYRTLDAEWIAAVDREELAALLSTIHGALDAAEAADAAEELLAAVEVPVYWERTHDLTSPPQGARIDAGAPGPFLYTVTATAEAWASWAELQGADYDARLVASGEW